LWDIGDTKREDAEKARQDGQGDQGEGERGIKEGEQGGRDHSRLPGVDTDETQESGAEEHALQKDGAAGVV
jgi:hypothetical protein